MNAKSHYKEHFPGHKILPGIPSSSYDISKGQMGLANAKFESHTTNKEHYKQWKAEPNPAYKELPSFTGSVLYPEGTHYLQTTNLDTYQGKTIKKPDQVKQAEGNIKIEGRIAIYEADMLCLSN